MAIERKIEWLKKRLQEPLPGVAAQLRMLGRARSTSENVPETARPSAVLCLLYPLDEVLHVLLIKRIEDGKAHSGQISFPGGRKDPWDTDLQATALREAHEEVGIRAGDIDVIGALTPLYIPVSNFQVHPFVAYAHSRPAFQLSPAEVAGILEISIDTLLHPESKAILDVRSPTMPDLIRNVHAYKLANGIIVWGATAMMISELEAVLEEYVA